jgi:Secretion system C-terminal sorting domain
LSLFFHFKAHKRYTGKIDSNQQISWVKVFGGTKQDAAVCACQVSDGGYAILAGTNSPDGDVTGLKGGPEIWLLRIDAVGNLLWEKTYGSTQSEIAVSIANTPDNGFIILSTTNGSDGDVPFHYGSIWRLDWLVIKTDSAGTVEWSKNIGGSGDEAQRGTILSIDSNYYLISSSWSHDYDCTDTAWHAGTITGNDYFIFKLDNSGNIWWNKSYGGTGDEIVYRAIFDERDSTIVITGNGGSNDYIETDQHGEGDMLTIKVDKNGTLLWHKSLGGRSIDNGKSIVKGPNKGYLVMGSTQPHPDTVAGDIGAEDILFYVLDSLGNTVSYKIFGGTDYEQPVSIVPYLKGYAISGSSMSAEFTEGSTYGNFAGGGAFISYIDSITLWVKDLQHVSGGVLSIYPNPAQGVVRVNYPQGNNANLTVINSVGAVMYRQQVGVQSGSVELGLSSWAAGVYMVIWKGEDGAVVSGRVVRE